MKKKLLRTLLPLAALAVVPAQAQVNVNREKYPDFTATVKADPNLKAVRTTGRPSRVNNAETPYFPSVFNQAGGSCGSASRISYMFNYEINALRGADASLPENQYPSHFTWLLTNSNSGKEGMAAANGIPNVTVYGGRTYSRVFGNQDCADDDFGWMQGYNKWYSAMFNRIVKNANFPESVKTEAGREAVKNWLWNHNGDPDFKAGGICGIGVASAGNWQRIPQTEANDANSVTGKYYVQDWGAQVDHALTIVGYDDNIEFDLDGNGVAGEKDKDEVGAWIVVNSWGAGWCNNGFIYCPYAKAVPTKTSTDFYKPEVYYARKNYRPLRTIKILMEYSKRSELRLSAGISADLADTLPEKSVLFEHFKFAGDGNGAPDANTPMLGRWADGMHYEPMEFGYDLTDLSANFDTSRSLKYFFIIESKASASGKGKIHACSIMDYEFDEEGIETAFATGAEGVEIRTAGEKTIISVVVTGEPVNIPLNAAYADGRFTWSAPAVSPYSVAGYNVWCNDTLAATVAADVTSFEMPDANGSYQVSALYKMGDKDVESKRTAAPAAPYCGTTPETNYVRAFSGSGFTINDIFAQKLENATVEFWIKPQSTTNYNQQMGPGWYNFMSHTTSTGQFVVGWDTSNRITSPVSTLRAGQWTHIAYTVKGNLLTLYANGQQVGQITGASSGIGGWEGGFTVGMQGTNGLFGQLDEMRIWNVVRSEQDIRRMMYAEVADPKNQYGLIFEMKMDEAQSADLSDATGNYTITPLGGMQSRSTNNTLLQDNRELVADFAFVDTTATVSCAVLTKNLSSGNATEFSWTVEGEPALSSTADAPAFVFMTPGVKTVTLVATAPDGRRDTTNRDIRVEALALPQPSFLVPEKAMLGNRISYINTTTTPGCTYEWTLEGGTPNKATSINVATRYAKPGRHTVTLRATNAAGTATATQELYVYDVEPTAAFEIQPSVLLKGGTVKLVDASQHYPEEWAWKVEDRAHHFVFNEQNPELTLADPGVYDVELVCANGSGRAEKTQRRAITVSNADPQTGLNFSGAQTVTFDNPITLAENKAFTMDWWIYPKNSTASTSNQIGGTLRNLLVRTRNDGTVILSMGGRSYYSPSGLVNASEWHHVALSFDKGYAALYIDGRHIETFETPYVDTDLTLPATLALGGSSAPMTAVIDEFRIWNSALTGEEIRAYANQPIANVAEAEAKHKLALYYQFNQNSGDVVDATSNALTGTRNGFGPDGDSWSSSLGAFCLSNAQRTDVTADYLTNYRKPFLATEEVMNPAAPQYVGLLTETAESAWVMLGAGIAGDVTTGLSVDTENGNRLALQTKVDNFAGSVSDHRIYQTVTLPAGHYVFGVESDDADHDTESYVVAAAGTGLPTTESLKNAALGYADLGTMETSFSLYKETAVSLGLLMNTRGERNLYFDRFYLEKKETNDDFTWTGIDTPADAVDNLSITPVDGGVVITAAHPVSVKVYTLAGIEAYAGVVSGTKRIMLPAGLYIVGGEKFIVK